MSNQINVCCPACVRFSPTPLKLVGEELVCTRISCSARYERYQGIPVLVTKSGDFLNFISKSNIRKGSNEGMY
jgi:hypothetical protein